MPHHTALRFWFVRFVHQHTFFLGGGVGKGGAYSVSSSPHSLMRERPLYCLFCTLISITCCGSLPHPPLHPLFPMGHALGIKLTTGQRRESYDGVHYSDLTYDAFAQVAVNLVAHLENTGTIGAARVIPTPSAKPFVKEIVGMGSVLLGLVVVFLASVMVLSRDAYHGIARLAITCLGGRHVDRGSLTWEATYGELLRKLGKHPDRHKTLSMAAGGARERARSSTGGGGVEDDDGEAEKGLLDEGEGEGTAGRGETPSTKHLP